LAVWFKGNDLHEDHKDRLKPESFSPFNFSEFQHGILPQATAEDANFKRLTVFSQSTADVL
jgi:hypothetical protein